MRIIGGKYKGKKIVPNKKIEARPTTDLAKEGLFNILTNRITFEGIAVLDLFTGTGNIAFEFASRGASLVIAVDINRVSGESIYTNAKALGADIKIRRFDAFRFLAKCVEKFDVIFADPPYDLKRVKNLVDLVFENEVLLPGGIFILEHSRDHNFAGNQYFVEARKYGKVNFSFFKLPD